MQPGSEHLMNFKQIASYDNYLLANMTLGMLQANDITCHLKDEHIVTIDPLLNPAVGGIKLLVSEPDYRRALRIIKDAETAYLKEIPCPNCHSYSLAAEEETNQPKGFWGRLKNQIAYGQTATYRKYYICGQCKHVFPEIPVS